MKIRNGFVSNSSSSSFIAVATGTKERNICEIFKDDSYCDSSYFSIPIDEFIEKLQEAKNNGHNTLYINYGVEYDG